MWLDGGLSHPPARPLARPPHLHQAHYEPGRGEFGRHDSGIVSDNTAGVNGAAPDLARFPRYARAQARATVCAVQPGDCLYLPQGVHHHVFSEADAALGYNLAVNIWVYRPGEGTAHRQPGEAPFTLDRLRELLAAGAKEERPPSAEVQEPPQVKLRRPPSAKLLAEDKAEL